jgi:hypothetical protein
MVDGARPFESSLERLECFRRNTIIMAVMQIATTPPTTPPAMAPTGRGVAVKVGLDVLVEDVVVEFDVVVEDDEGVGYPGGYCVPVLTPRVPVKKGKSIGTVWPTNVAAARTVDSDPFPQLNPTKPDAPIL